jgi:hypothetical protein
MATVWGRGFGVRVAVESTTSPYRPDGLWVPPNFVSNGYRELFPREREADHSPPTNAQVRKAWTYTSTPPYAFVT